MSDNIKDRATWAEARAKELAGVLREVIERSSAYAICEPDECCAECDQMREVGLIPVAALARYDAGPDAGEEA